jgi:hypothetical protein
MTYPYSPQGIAELGCGDHLGCFYQSEEEYRWAFTSLVGWGLQLGEKVICITGEHTAETLLRYLQVAGLDVDSSLNRGALVILPVSDVASPQDHFDPEQLLALIQRETERALAEGYTLLRGIFEMDQVLQGFSGCTQWLDYEEQLNNLFPGSQCMVACMYNLARFDRRQLVDVLRLHPLTTVGTELYDNFEYTPQAELLGKDFIRGLVPPLLEPTPLVKRRGIAPPAVESDARLYIP